MSQTILLYGATGFSGRLIAAVAASRWAESPGGFRLVLGGRDAAALRRLASEHEVEHRVFGLDDRPRVRGGLSGVDVLINAAGPFASTAERLVKTALEVGCHYVDINGEVDVYKRLDDCGRFAEQRQVTLVCGAGHMSATSDLLLDAALTHLRNKQVLELGAIRFALSRIIHFSRGSVASVWRSMREQVSVVRGRAVIDGGKRKLQPVLWHVPIGRLERTFDFGPRRDRETPRQDLRIASAVNLVDTLTARRQVMRHGASVQSIESYMETTAAGRIGYQLGALSAPLCAAPWLQILARSQIAMLPEGPTAAERERSPNTILIQIEDAIRTPVIDWRLQGPNTYDLTAQLVTAIAEKVATGPEYGWRTPVEVLGAVLSLKEPDQAGPLRRCRLDQRVTVE